MDALPELRGRRALAAAPASVAAPDGAARGDRRTRATMLVHDPRRALPEPPPVRARSGGVAGAPGEVLAPIPGNVLQVLVEPGQVGRGRARWSASSRR